MHKVRILQEFFFFRSIRVSFIEGVGDVNICIEDLVRVETPQKEVWLQHRRNKKPFIVENQYQDLID